jgi:hypothetical protein
MFAKVTHNALAHNPGVYAAIDTWWRSPTLKWLQR